MEASTEIRSIVLSSYPNIGPLMRLLSTLLNPTKVLLTDGPRPRHRDWRGLASLVNISSERESFIASSHQDQTKQVWELWRQTPEVTLGNLLDHLESLDRFDAYYDIVEFVTQNLPINHENQALVQNNPLGHDEEVVDPRAITYYDSPGNYPIFHAYIIYAQKDSGFVKDMKEYLERELGFLICTRDDLRPGFATEYAPIAQLITNRCRRVIIVYSPDFLRSNENAFYADFTQANNISTGRVTMVPLIYRECQPPAHLATIVSLHCSSPNFWRRLEQCLDNTRTTNTRYIAPPPLHQPPRMLTSSQSSAHSVNIVTADSDRYSASARPNDISLNHSGYSVPNQASLQNPGNLDNRQGRLSPRLVSPAYSQSNLASGRVHLAPSQANVVFDQVSRAHSQTYLAPSQDNAAYNQVSPAHSQNYLAPSQDNAAYNQVSPAHSQSNLTSGPVHLTTSQSNLAFGQSVAASQAHLIPSQDLTGSVNQDSTADSLNPVENGERPRRFISNAYNQLKKFATKRGKKASKNKKTAQLTVGS